jgi:hypothetical protein
MLTWLIIGLLAAALVLFVKHRRNLVLGGLPFGELVAADNEEQECPVLVSQRYGLKGRPDALVRTDAGAIIPIERKRTLAPPRGRYDSGLFQAISYGILVEDDYGQPPPCVRIQSADRWFDEPYPGARKQWASMVSQRLGRRGGQAIATGRMAWRRSAGIVG